MKLNRWEVDQIYQLVTLEINRVSQKRRELIDLNDPAANNTDTRQRLSQLIILKTKVDRLRKRNDITKKNFMTRRGPKPTMPARPSHTTRGETP